MRVRIVVFLVSMLLAAGGVLLSSIPRVAAQPKLKNEDRRRTFGHSIYKSNKNTGSGSEKKPGENPDDEIIKVKTDLVVNDVLVVNQKGNVVLGLGKDDFVITEDGAAQEVGLFSFGEAANVPRSIVLIIDYSGSQFPYIKNSIEAAKLLVDKLAPQDRMAIVTDDVELLVDFTRDKALLKRELEFSKAWRAKVVPEEEVKKSIYWSTQQQLALMEIAKLSGGYIDFLEKPEDDGGIYATLFTTINNRYVVGYYPSNQAQDGKRRILKIEVRGHPEFTVVGRRSYFSQRAEASNP